MWQCLQCVCTALLPVDLSLKSRTPLYFCRRSWGTLMGAIIFLCLGPKTLTTLSYRECLQTCPRARGYQNEVMQGRLLKAQKWEESLHHPYLWGRMIFKYLGPCVRTPPCVFMCDDTTCHQMWYDQILSLKRGGLWSSANDCRHAVRLDYH